MSPFNPRTPDLVAFQALQAEYRDMIWNIAMDEPLSGYNKADDLPELSDEDRALVLRVNPSLHEPLRPAILKKVLADVQTECESRADKACGRQQDSYYGDSTPQTDRERAQYEFRAQKMLDNCTAARALTANETY